NASPRPAAVNDNVRQGTAVQTGVRSRSELTFKDQTITRLGEQTIFSVGEGPRTIDLGSGQFLLLCAKKRGGRTSYDGVSHVSDFRLHQFPATRLFVIANTFIAFRCAIGSRIRPTSRKPC